MCEKSSLDNYLYELLKPTKSSQVKLVAAWEGLTTETQIKILSAMNTIPDEIIQKGLNSANDYIRYLIASKYTCPSTFENCDKNKKIIEMISKDKSPLVRYTHFPSTKMDKNTQEKLTLNPSTFFEISHVEQFLLFNKLSLSDAEMISAIIYWGYENNVGHEHLRNLISELKDNFNEEKLDYSLSKFSQRYYEKFLKSLWNLVQKLENTELAMDLVFIIPVWENVLNKKFFDKLIKSLPETLAKELLNRDDFNYIELRKKIVNAKDGRYTSIIIKAANKKLQHQKTKEYFEDDEDDEGDWLSNIFNGLIIFVCIIFAYHIDYGNGKYAPILLMIPSISYFIKSFYNKHIKYLSKRLFFYLKEKEKENEEMKIK